MILYARKYLPLIEVAGSFQMVFVNDSKILFKDLSMYMLTTYIRFIIVRKIPEFIIYF